VRAPPLLILHVQDRWHARLYFCLPLLRVSMALLWIGSGVVGWLASPADVVAAAPSSSPSVGSLLALARISASADLLLGALCLLRWRPRFEDVRDEPHLVTFTARNGGLTSASTRITVRPDLVLNPSFEVNESGWAGHLGATLARVAGGRRSGSLCRPVGTTSSQRPRTRRS